MKTMMIAAVAALMASGAFAGALPDGWSNHPSFSDRPMSRATGQKLTLAYYGVRDRGGSGYTTSTSNSRGRFGGNGWD